MFLQVRFLGLCLFRATSSDHSTFEVLLPDTTVRSAHKDRTRADRHETALLIASGARPQRIEEALALDHSRIVLQAADAPRPNPLRGTTPGLDRVPNINKFATNIQADHAMRPGGNTIASMTVSADALATFNEPNNGNKHWRFPDLLRPGHKYRINGIAETVVWSVEYNNGVELRLEGHDGELQKSLQLQQDTVIYIVNVCEHPNSAVKATRKPQTPGAQVKDTDFRWFYNLLKSSSGPTLEDRVRHGFLPIPISVMPVEGEEDVFLLSADTPTCLCGKYCECHPEGDD